MRGTSKASSFDKFKQALADYDVPETLAAIIFAKRQELCKYLTQHVLCQTTDSMLVDYNFNIETVISSDSFSKVNEQLLNLEMVLKC